MSNEPQSPAFQQLSASNHGPAVVVVSYILLVLALVTVITRLITRIRVTRKLQIDDWLIILSKLLFLAQTIAVTFAANNGLGKHRDTLSASSFDAFGKAFYVAEIVGVLTLVMAKASTNILVMSIHPPKRVILACWCNLILTIIWGLGLTFAIGFQCSLPKPWNYEAQCVNQHALSINVGIWNVVTDLMLVMLPFFLMRKVQVSEQKRWIVIGLFTCRIIVPGLSIAAVVEGTLMYTSTPRDVTWHAVAPSLWTQAVISLSIVTACVPCIKRFLADLSSGMIMVNISHPLELSMKNSSSKNDRYRPSGSTLRNGRDVFASKLFSGLRTSVLSSEKSKEKSTLGALSQNKSAISHSDKFEKTSFDGERRSRYMKTTPDFRAGGQATNTNYIERSESMKGLRENVIVQTIDYEVNFEEVSEPEIRQDSEDNDRIKSFDSINTRQAADSMEYEKYGISVKGPESSI